MDELSEKFWVYVGNAGIASMACTFVAVISYLQEAMFDNWGMVFKTWGMGLIAAILFYFGFNIKSIATKGMSVPTALFALGGALVPLFAMVIGKIAMAI